MRRRWLALVPFLLTGCFTRKQAKGPVLREGVSDIAVRAAMSFPDEVEDQTQASLLACQGAAAEAQAVLLSHILKKKAASGEPLYEAEIPHIQVQERVRTLVKSAAVLETTVRDKNCTVTIGIPKSQLRPILRDAK